MSPSVVARGKSWSSKMFESGKKLTNLFVADDIERKKKM